MADPMAEPLRVAARLRLFRLPCLRGLGSKLEKSGGRIFPSKLVGRAR